MKKYLVSIALALTAPLAKAEPVFLGYYPCWLGDDYPPAKIDFKPFTHVCHAFLQCKEDGTVFSEGNVPSPELTGLGHKAGVKVLISLGGENSGKTFNPMAADPKARKAFVVNVLKVMDDNGYDGVDVDWEDPETNDDKANYTLLATELRQALDALGKKKGRPYLMTAAFPATDWSGKWFDGPALVGLFDFVNIMAYDLAGDWTEVATHDEPLKASSKDPEGANANDEGIMNYWLQKKGFTKDKLVLGSAFHGKALAVAKPYDPIIKGKKPPFYGKDYNELLDLMKQGWKRWWDEESQVPWLLSPEGTAVLGYEDEQSVALKASWAKAQGFRGFFFWDMNADRLPDGSHPLTAAASAAWVQGPRP